MFEVKRYPLPQPLPVKVSGLKGLSLPVEYNLDTRRVRFLSALENTRYTAFDPRNADQRYYPGEALSWNQPELVVNLVPEETGFKLERHNPTEQPLTAELKRGRTSRRWPPSAGRGRCTTRGSPESPGDPRAGQRGAGPIHLLT